MWFKTDSENVKLAIKCHLFGISVGRQMVTGTVDGGDEVVGVVWRRSFFRLFQNTFNNCSLTLANSIDSKFN